MKLNGYVCFYGQRRIEVYASSSYQAQQEVAKQLKVPAKKQYQISVNLAELGGKPVVHTPDF
jgi:hypothetical protein